MYDEMAFISYYFHWDRDSVLGLAHAERRKWCAEISEINKSLSPSDEKGAEKSIVDMIPTRMARMS